MVQRAIVSPWSCWRFGLVEIEFLPQRIDENVTAGGHQDVLELGCCDFIGIWNGCADVKEDFAVIEGLRGTSLNGYACLGIAIENGVRNR